MFVVIPLFCFCLMALVLYQRAKQRAALPSWRRAVLSASVIWGSLLTIITELLSLFSLLTFGWVLALWLVATLVAAALYLRLRRGEPWLAAFSFRAFSPRALVKRIKAPLSLALLLAGVATILLVVGLIALIAPPNTWDSMTYHMARVVHWIQDQSLAFYPTNIIRQLHQPPWAEYAILHMQLLSGGDYFANSVQWFSMLVSLIGVSLIAQQLGADLRGQIFAVVIAASIPMGILQASGTQNDYVVGLWLVCCLYYLFAYKAHPNWPDALGAGASLGLACLTKGTAYVFAAPFILWFIIWGIRSLRWHVWKPALGILSIAFALNIGFYARNISLFSNPLGPADATSLYTNDVFSFSTLTSNVIRNLSLEFGTPSNRVNNWLAQELSHLFGHLGIDSNDPRTTWHGTTFQINGGNLTWLNEVVADNLLHLLLIVVVIVLCLAFSYLRKQPILLQYLVALIGGFLLFSLYLKWQPWGSRLLFPLLILFAPLCAVVLAALPKPRLASAVVWLLLLASVPWVFYNQSRPLLGSTSILTTSRLDQYFINRTNIETPYVDAARVVQSTGCENIGLSFGGLDGWGYPLGLDAWEYPFWVLLNPGNQHTIRIEQVTIHNSSAPLEQEAQFASFHPCAIIAVRFTSDQSSALNSNGEMYGQVWSSRPIDNTFTVAVFMQPTGRSATALEREVVDRGSPGAEGNAVPAQTRCNRVAHPCSAQRASNHNGTWNQELPPGQSASFILLLLTGIWLRQGRLRSRHWRRSNVPVCTCQHCLTSPASRA